jgi:serine/threonine-protein kinase
MRGSAHPIVLAVAVVLTAAGAGVTTARAQAPTEAVRRADALFKEGRTLIEGGKFAEACPKFEESQRLDPGLGTLLNLAACYEQVGRLASALTAFRSAEEQARAAGPSEKKREQAAAERARALESRVARLTITLAPGDRPDGFTVTRDGVPVRALDFGRRIAVDAGTIVIEAHAPDHLAFRSEVVIASDTTARTVDVPPLQAATIVRLGDGPMGVGGGGGGGSDVAPIGGAEATAARSPRKKIGLVVGAVGLAALGGGVALGLSAKGQYDDVPCTQGSSPPTGCTPAEEERISDARSRGNLGTIVGGVGVAALLGGAVLYLTAPDERPVKVAPLVTGRALGVAFAGRF